MIAQAAWFNRRKYTGWGLSPKNLQGWLYIAGLVGVIMLIGSAPIGEQFKLILTGSVTVFILVDVLQVMASMKLDEREQKVEAIAERNASWTMVTASVLVVLYVSTLGKSMTGIELTPALIMPVIAGTIAKGITSYILDRRGV